MGFNRFQRSDKSFTSFRLLPFLHALLQRMGLENLDVINRLPPKTTDKAVNHRAFRNEFSTAGIWFGLRMNFLFVNGSLKKDELWGSWV